MTAGFKTSTWSLTSLLATQPFQRTPIRSSSTHPLSRQTCSSTCRNVSQCHCCFKKEYKVELILRNQQLCINSYSFYLKCILGGWNHCFNECNSGLIHEDEIYAFSGLQGSCILNFGEGGGCLKYFKLTCIKVPSSSVWVH